jgi:hypothetical protein
MLYMNVGFQKSKNDWNFRIIKYQNKWISKPYNYGDDKLY